MYKIDQKSSKIGKKWCVKIINKKIFDDHPANDQALVLLPPLDDGRPNFFLSGALIFQDLFILFKNFSQKWAQ